jgi:glycine/D-amino acid oxidase-like deaminating enzyme
MTEGAGVEMNGEPAGWYQTTQVENPLRPRLNFELDVDVCVIGGGLAGLTTAREIARRGWSVAVLEGGRIGGRASGANVGFVVPGCAENVDTMVERIGLDHTKELWAQSQRGVEYVRDTIAETGMPGIDPADGWLQVSKTDNWREIQNRVERLRWIGANVEAWPAERVRAVLPSARYFGAMHFPRAFHIHPLNYTIGLARLAELAGARIFEDTPALEIDAAGVRKRIQTPAARVRAGHIVLAANVQLGSLMPQLAATLMPVTTYVVETEPLGPALADVVRYRGAVSDSEKFDSHYRIVGGDRLQWSGQMTVWEGVPRRFARGLIARIRRTFPQLGAVAAAHAWSGTFGRTLHHMPQIGEIEPGVWVTSGFGRHGLNTTALAGDLVARGIVDNDQTWRLFAPFELVWAGGKLFRAVAQGMYLASRPASAARQAMARRRERRRKRRDAKVQKLVQKLAQKSVQELAQTRRAAVAAKENARTRATVVPVPEPPAPKPPSPAKRKRGATAELLPTPALLTDSDEPADKPQKRRKRPPR